MMNIIPMMNNTHPNMSGPLSSMNPFVHVKKGMAMITIPIIVRTAPNTPKFFKLMDRFVFVDNDN